MIIRQYLEPLSIEQLKEDYVHRLPCDRKAVNLRSLKRWRRFPVGTELIKLLPMESSALVAQQKYQEQMEPILPQGAAISVGQFHEGVFSPKYIELPVSNFDCLGTVTSVTSALCQLNRLLNVHRRDFPEASRYCVSHLKKRDKGTVYQLPNNYKAVAMNSLYHDYRPELDTPLIKMQVDDVWHIEAYHVDFHRTIEVYAVMGSVRKGSLGRCNLEEEVMTIMLDVATGKRSITDYKVKEPSLMRRLGVG